MKKSDSWCRPVLTPKGHTVSGGAARNVRIAALGGMDEIVADVVRDTFIRAEKAVQNRKMPNLRLVANSR